MSKIITQNDLIRYAYNETSFDENCSIQQALDSNWDLQEEYKTIIQTQALLSLFKQTSPNKSSVRIIMDYNKRLEELLPTC